MKVETSAEALMLYVSAVRDEAEVRTASSAPLAIRKVDRRIVAPEEVLDGIAGAGESRRTVAAYMISGLFHSLLHAPETMRLAEKKTSRAKTDNSLVISRTVDIQGFGPLDLSHAITLVKSDGARERRDVYKLMVGGIPDLSPDTQWTNDPVIETFATPTSKLESESRLGRTLDALSSIVDSAGI